MSRREDFEEMVTRNVARACAEDHTFADVLEREIDSARAARSAQMDAVNNLVREQVAATKKLTKAVQQLEQRVSVAVANLLEAIDGLSKGVVDRQLSPRDAS